VNKLLLIALFLLAGTAVADTPEFTLVIRGHRFEPAELIIPAGQKVKLLIQNKDSTVEEFESYELAREKIIPGNSSTSLYIGPLKAGRYPFFGEFNPNSANGVVIAQ
jgi:hypothetical protein